MAWEPQFDAIVLGEGWTSLWPLKDELGKSGCCSAQRCALERYQKVSATRAQRISKNPRLHGMHRMRATDRGSREESLRKTPRTVWCFLLWRSKRRKKLSGVENDQSPAEIWSLLVLSTLGGKSQWTWLFFSFVLQKKKTRSQCPNWIKLSRIPLVWDWYNSTGQNGIFVW